MDKILWTWSSEQKGRSINLAREYEALIRQDWTTKKGGRDTMSNWNMANPKLNPRPPMMWVRVESLASNSAPLWKTRSLRFLSSADLWLRHWRVKRDFYSLLRACLLGIDAKGPTFGCSLQVDDNRLYRKQVVMGSSPTAQDYAVSLRTFRPLIILRRAASAYPELTTTLATQNKTCICYRNTLYLCLWNDTPIMLGGDFFVTYVCLFRGQR